MQIFTNNAIKRDTLLMYFAPCGLWKKDLKALCFPRLLGGNLYCNLFYYLKLKGQEGGCVGKEKEEREERCKGSVREG